MKQIKMAKKKEANSASRKMAIQKKATANSNGTVRWLRNSMIPPKPKSQLD